MSAYDLERAVHIAKAIDALAPEHTGDDVMGLFATDEYELFHFMDESPGHDCFDELRTPGTAYGEWHRRLRVARNDPEVTWPFS